MKRRTRNYSRRQLTWMRKLPGVLQLDLTERAPEAAAADIAAAWLGT
jgi:tRNA dimethylallyltransferase